MRAARCDDSRNRRRPLLTERSVFALKHVADDGTEHLFHVDQVQPLGFDAFRDCLRDGRRSHPTVMWGTHRDRNHRTGASAGERVRMTFPLEFNERIPFYGLVDGGVVPPMYLPPGCVLVLDRNVVAALTRTGNSKHPEAPGEAWMFEFLNSSTFKLNPALGALEGANRRTPTFEEFRGDVHATGSAIRARLPKVQVVEFTDDVLSRLHAWRTSFDARAESEGSFLLAVAPLLKDATTASRLETVEEAVLGEAHARGLETCFVVLTALAVLYEAPGGADGGAARAVLKPTGSYSEADAYNALADLRQLELLAASRGVPQFVALLTADQRLALLWCGLGVQDVQVEANNTRFRLNPDPALFPRLPPERRSILFKAH